MFGIAASPRSVAEAVLLLARRQPTGAPPRAQQTSGLLCANAHNGRMSADWPLGTPGSRHARRVLHAHACRGACGRGMARARRRCSGMCSVCAHARGIGKAVQRSGQGNGRARGRSCDRACSMSEAIGAGASHALMLLCEIRFHVSISHFRFQISISQCPCCNIFILHTYVPYI